MRVPRFFLDRILCPQTEILLEGSLQHYIAQVLRLKLGDACLLFRGDGLDYPATIVEFTKKNLRLKVAAPIEVNRESPIEIHLGQAIAKGERMEFILQKVTELGVTHIHPLFSVRSEVHLEGERLQKKMQHWLRIIISACEQCGRSFLPKLFPPVFLQDWTRQVNTEARFMLDPKSTQNFNSELKFKSATLLIGPEGGLAEEEIQQASHQKFEAMRLGPRILRTETAALAAITALQLYAGDL